MKPYLQNFLPYIFLILFFSGCSSPVHNLVSVSNPDTLLNNALKLNQVNFPLEGNASLNIETKEKGQKLSCKMNYNSSDTIKLSINTGFGYGLITIWLTPDSFFVSNRLTKQFISSSYKSSQLEDLLGFPFSYADIEALFLGKLVISENMQLTRTLDEPENVVFIYRGLENSEKIWISKTLSKISRLQKTNRKGRVILDITLDRFKEIKTNWFAHQIQVYKPDNGQKLSIYFNMLESNDTKSLKIEIPENMDRISF